MHLRRLTATAILLSCSAALGLVAQQDDASQSQLELERRRAAGLSMLQHASLTSRGFDPVDRVSVQFIVTYTIAQADPSLSAQSWGAAYDSLLGMKPEELQSLWAIPGEIVRNTALVDPQKIENELPPEYLRSTAAAALIEHYADRNTAKAVDLMDRLEAEPALSDSADAILAQLDLEADRGLATSIYLKVLRFYQNNEKPLNTLGYPNDLAKLTLKYWKSLPQEVVLSAVDEILKQAGEIDSAGKRKAVVLRNSSTRVRTAGVWQYRALQLIPVVRELNPSMAQQWAKQLGAAHAGDVSTAADLAAVGTGPQADGTVNQLNHGLQESAYFQKILEEAQQHPDEALAKVKALQDVRTRADLLLNFARNLWKTHPEAASRALDGFEELVCSDPKLVNARTTGQLAAAISIRMNHIDQAKHLLKVSLARIAADYANDADRDDPNLAALLFWPSVHEWRDVLQVAYQVSPEFSLELLNEVPEGRVRTLEEALLASSFLKVEPWRSISPMVDKKSLRKPSD